MERQYVLVTDSEHPFFREVGVYFDTLFSEKGERRDIFIVKGCKMPLHEKDILWTPNALLLLEERVKLFPTTAELFS